jgi:hypothetical protein
LFTGRPILLLAAFACMSLVSKKPARREAFSFGETNPTSKINRCKLGRTNPSRFAEGSHWAGRARAATACRCRIASCRETALQSFWTFCTNEANGKKPKETTFQDEQYARWTIEDAKFDHCGRSEPADTGRLRDPEALHCGIHTSLAGFLLKRDRVSRETQQRVPAGCQKWYSKGTR